LTSFSESDDVENGVSGGKPESGTTIDYGWETTGGVTSSSSSGFEGDVEAEGAEPSA